LLKGYSPQQEGISLLGTMWVTVMVFHVKFAAFWYDQWRIDFSKRNRVLRGFGEVERSAAIARMAVRRIQCRRDNDTAFL